MDASSASRVEQAIAVLARKGCHFEFDDDGVVNSIYVSGASFSKTDLGFFDAFPDIRKFHLDECNLDHLLWRHLEQMSNLEGLALRGSNISDERLQHLEHFPKLRTLDLNSTPVGDDGLVHVAKLR